MNLLEREKARRREGEEENHEAKAFAARQIRCLGDTRWAMTPQSQNIICLRLFENEQ